MTNNVDPDQTLRFAMLRYHMGRVKRESALEHQQNTQIQIILRMREVSSGPLLPICTLCSVPLRKQAYSTILNILQPITENFQIKKI